MEYETVNDHKIVPEPISLHFIVSTMMMSMRRTTASLLKQSKVQLPVSSNAVASLADSNTTTTDHSNHRWQTAPTLSNNNTTHQIRSFHSTPRREIVPLIGAAVIFGVARYSWKALKRMDEDWEDYQWELQQYDKQRARSGGNDPSRTIGIDLGTVYTKLAKSHPKPEVLISREGDRQFFNGILYPENSDNGHEAQRGRAALEKFYFEQEDQEEDDGTANKVQLPWKMLLETNDDAIQTVSDVLTPALTEAFDRLDYHDNSKKQQLRTTVTVPVQLTLNDNNVYSTGFSKVLPDLDHTTVLLPDPVAAVWGAQHKNLLPADGDPHKPKTFLVMDVGGYTTQLSIVQKDVVLNHLTLQWGGETPIELLVGLLAAESPSPLTDARSLSALQTQARMAVAELAGKSRVQVHVPYLYADPANHHLDTTVSRPVLEQEIQADIRHRLVSSIIADQVENDALLVLSPHMPSPTDLQSLWTSSVTQLLEISQQTPMTLDHILLVGGGFKSPATVESARAALYALMGPDAVNKTVVPDSSLLSELTALGAASMLPGYEYSMETGLYKQNE
jgi:molecular chaperone DnaK (HSP70)